MRDREYVGQAAASAQGEPRSSAAQRGAGSRPPPLRAVALKHPDLDSASWCRTTPRCGGVALITRRSAEFAEYVERLRELSSNVEVFYSIEHCSLTSSSVALLLLDIADEPAWDCCGQAAVRYFGRLVVISDDPSMEPEAFDSGAYDFFTWPRDANRLLRRTTAMLRVHTDRTDDCTERAVYVGQRRVVIGANAIRITASEERVLQVLLQARGDFVSAATIARSLGQLEHQSGNVRFHMSRLRLKLGPHASHLQTEPGLGYRFVLPRP